MTNETQTAEYKTFKCPSLYTSGGIAEAIVKLETGKPTGVICTKYCEGECEEILSRKRVKLLKYQKGNPEYDWLTERLTTDITNKMGIKASFFSNILPTLPEGKQKSLEAGVLQEIERLKFDAIKAMGRSPCIIAEGFKEIK